MGLGLAGRDAVEDDGEDAGDGAGVGGTARKTALSFSDDKDAEKDWDRSHPRTATAEFWEFVGDRYAGDNTVFTIDDEAMGEGIQLHLYADAVARYTTARKGGNGSAPEYRIEYSLVDGMGGYRTLVSVFVRGGCVALDEHGSWMADLADLARARRERDAAE